MNSLYVRGDLHNKESLCMSVYHVVTERFPSLLPADEQHVLHATLLMALLGNILLGHHVCSMTTPQGHLKDVLDWIVSLCTHSAFSDNRKGD